MMSDAELARVLAPQANQRQSVAAIQRGLAMADSADGKVKIRIPGHVIAPDDDTAGESGEMSSSERGILTIPTLGAISAGAIVDVLTYGELGGSHSLVALGAVGEGDADRARLAGAVEKADDAMTMVDSMGERVSTLEGQVPNGVTIQRITRWEAGQTWTNLASSPVSAVTIDGIIVSNKYIGVLIAHVKFNYTKSAAENAWTGHNLLSLTDWTFPYVLNSGTYSVIRDTSPHSAGWYLGCPAGSDTIYANHFDQMAGGKNIDIHCDLCWYVSAKNPPA